MEEVVAIFMSDLPLRPLAGAAIMLLLVLALLIVHRRNKTSIPRQIEHCLRPLKKDEVSSVIIPDGIGGLIEIDRLILMEQGILILQTYPMAGHLFGAEHIEQWSQIIRGRSFKFANPLRHLHNAKQALQLLAPKVPVFCRVVFTAETNFPKGKPEEVSVLKSLEQDLQPLMTAPRLVEQTNAAWQRILRIARKNGQAVLREATD